MTQRLAGTGFVLRPWRQGDEPALVRYANNRKVWINLTDRFPHPYTPEAARDWVSSQVAEAADPATSFAIEVEGVAVGGIGFNRGSDLGVRTGQIGYWLGEPFWGRGIATEALRLASDHAFREFDFVRLEAHVLEWNPASARVLEKAGYALESRQRQAATKDGQILDLLIYTRLRS